MFTGVWKTGMGSLVCREENRNANSDLIGMLTWATIESLSHFLLLNNH